MTDKQDKLLCPKCNIPMAKAGKGWSGLHKVQRYRCSGCGKAIQRSGHTLQSGLGGLTTQTLEATALPWGQVALTCQGMYTIHMMDEIKKVNKNAKALSKLGASKGGKARSAVLTSEQRKEIGRNAIRARWAKVKGIPLDTNEQVSTSLDLSHVHDEIVQIQKASPAEIISHLI